MNTIFVYGLLKPGFSLHHLVAPYVQRSLPGSTRGRLYDAGVPAARFDEDGDIEGFVFWLDEPRLEEALEMLDDIEDEGDMYERGTVEVATADGPVAAHAYHYLRDLTGCRFVGHEWPKDSIL